MVTITENVPHPPAHRFVAPTAVSVDDMSTGEQLVGAGMGSAEDRRLAPVVIQRWESDGGALRAVSHA
jgi:hypothetical protein